MICPSVLAAAAPVETAIGRLLPQAFHVEYFDVKLWQWIGMLVAVVLALIASWLTTWVAYRVLRSLVSRTETRLDDALLDITIRPSRLLTGILFFYVGTLLLQIDRSAAGLVTALVKAGIILAMTWFFLRLVDGLKDQIKIRLEEEGKQAVVAILPLGTKTAKAFLVLIAAIAMLQHFGFNVTGLIAGLGVGGLALALAAQKTVENLFGGVTLIADQPVRVGEFCRFGDKIGTVEDIGLRSTRVRTLDRTVISVPNAEFSQTQIENFGKRDRIRMFIVLGLRYETSPDQLRHVLAGLRSLLRAHPKVLPDPARVRFINFGAFSLELEVFAYIRTSDWAEFLAIREDIYLRMMDVIAESGTGFAFPSQTLYMARDGGLSEERTRKAREAVQAWREESALPFPDFAPETIERLDDTLDYPPRGSAVGRPTG